MSESVLDLRAQLRSGSRTSEELVGQALDAAERSGSGAFVELLGNTASEAARTADRELAEGRDRGRLHGIPVAVKDNFDVAGTWTRCGTPGLGHHFAERDAAAVARLRAAGAVIIGKTRLHELAWGMTTPGCRNPRDSGRTAGGSSGGAAAAVAAGIVPVALGTDTGGSVRNPAALCSVVGVKTSPGGTAMSGVAPLAPTQDTVGVLGGTTGDCRIVLEVLGESATRRSVRRVGRIADAWAGRVQPEIADEFAEAAERLRGNGVEVVDVTLPHSGLASAASYVIMLAEGARHWWPAPRESVSPEVRDRLRLGARITDEDYDRALEVRAAIRRSLDEALGEVDALMLPSCSVPPSPIEADLVACAGRTIPVEAAHAAMTMLGSVSGLPAASVPSSPLAPGFLPSGVQFIAGDTSTVCECAALLEQDPATGTTVSNPTAKVGSAPRENERDG